MPIRRFSRKAVMTAALAWLIAAPEPAAPLKAQSLSPDAVATERVTADVRFLADDARQGRGVGTAGLDSAARYLATRFAEIGLQPAGEDGYYQPFLIDPSAPAAAHSSVGNAPVRNVVGIIPGRGRLAGEAVVMGAHYDHLGLGGAGSLDPDSIGMVHNGADDNASGTSALLEAARLLVQREATDQRSLIFVAFTAEELGLIGSEHYASHPAVATDSTIAMVNFDMVGRLRHDTLMAIGTGSARELPALLDSINAPHALVLIRSGDPYGRSDHSTFYARRIPVVHFFTNTHADYHRTTDDWEAINVRGIVRIARLAADLSWAFATRPARLTYLEVEPPPPMASGQGYGAYLGTIPDMTGSPEGVRLTGVRAGGPADQAGIGGGDVLVQIGEYEIKDLYDMTAALRAHQPGDTETVVVVRDGSRIELRATLGKRGG